MHNILIFGDSISAGRGVDKSKSWPSLLAQNFDSKDSYSTVVHNLSIPGESTNEVLLRFSSEVRARYKGALNENSYTIIFAIGINDAKIVGSSNKPRTSASDFEQNIRKLVQLAHEYTDQAIFIGPTKVDEKTAAQSSPNYFFNEQILGYSHIIKNICTSMGVTFVEMAQDIKNSDNNYLADDGIHLNELGHKMVYEKIVEFVLPDFTIIQKFDPFQILKKEYSLSEQDIIAIKSRFVDNTIFKHDFLLGQFNNEKTELIVGAPCIRKDIEGVSLNTFSQIFVPMKIANALRLPCKIFIGVKEEIILQPDRSDLYEKLGTELEQAVRRIANELGVEIEIINTIDPVYDKLIIETVEELNIQLTIEDSTYLFNLSLNKPQRQWHSSLRVLSSERVVACNTSYTLNKLFGEHCNLIVADISQHPCVLFSRKYEKNYKPPNFLAFLPLPSITGTGNMFKADTEEHFLLNQSEDYYKLIFKTSPMWVLETYGKLFNLVDGRETQCSQDFQSFMALARKISNYFSSSIK